MRLRLPELLDAHDPPLTPYAVVHHPRNLGRIKLTTMYRMVRSRGTKPPFTPAVLDALCDILGVGPGDLFEREATAAGATDGPVQSQRANGPRTAAKRPRAR